MIIEIEATDPGSLNEARRSLQNLVGNWGQEITDAAVATSADGADGKAINPVAIASLAVSLPSAALAVADLANRVRKRHRAAELIDHARQEAARQITITVMTLGHSIELATLTPDQLLDLQADHDPAR